MGGQEGHLSLLEVMEKDHSSSVGAVWAHPVQPVLVTGKMYMEYLDQLISLSSAVVTARGQCTTDTDHSEGREHLQFPSYKKV